MSIHMRNSW